MEGNLGSDADLKTASAAAETVGDVLARHFVNYSGSGVGLRGGTFSFTKTDVGHDFEIQDGRWATDLAVSGTVHWDQASGIINADLDVKGPNVASGQLKLDWNDRETSSLVRISGMLGGRTLKAERTAP